LKIKPMLVRLESALNTCGLGDKMLLLSGATPNSKAPRSTDPAITLMVGYNGSLKSQVALDITLWIAHQTRLATQKQVTVQVVYVVDQEFQTTQSLPTLTEDSLTVASWEAQMSGLSAADLALTSYRTDHPGAVTLPSAPEISRLEAAFHQDPFEQADQILWQARSLAEEWRGSLETHLRFGAVATELRNAIETQTADLLVLGCNSTYHPIVQQLGSQLPCPVVGVPSILVPEPSPRM
jgi:nucleotide-binding universal stress UspA family protein